MFTRQLEDSDPTQLIQEEIPIEMSDLFRILIRTASIYTLIIPVATSG